MQPNLKINKYLYMYFIKKYKYKYLNSVNKKVR